MRKLYIVCYDIADPKRLRSVHKLLCGYGDHLQYSVFQCVLLPEDQVRLKARLEKRIHHTQDQVLFFDLGPYDGRAKQRIESLGIAYEEADRKPIIV